LIRQPQAAGAEPAWVECVGFEHPLPLYQREQLPAGQQIQGPALIVEAVSTTLLAEHWQCRVDPYGNLLLERTWRLCICLRSEFTRAMIASCAGMSVL